MEHWQSELDKWLTTPPDDDSNFKCAECGNNIHAGDDYFVLDDENLCYDCAHEWLDAQKETATYEQCYGRV